MLTSGFDHVALLTADTDRLHDFYRHVSKPRSSATTGFRTEVDSPSSRSASRLS
jgi:catechol 2,3-dioxygenase-like lactoylglutathione lyase family enzyme